MSTKQKPFKIPKNLAEAADLLYTIRQNRLAKAKELEIFTKHETALRDHLINNLPKSKAEGVTGKLVNATITTKEVPQVEDWDKVYTYIKKNNAFDLLGRSLNSTAVKERWENKKKIPGVGVFTVTSLSLTAPKGKK